MPFLDGVEKNCTMADTMSLTGITMTKLALGVLKTEKNLLCFV
jgi:hypothetical protein